LGLPLEKLYEDWRAALAFVSEKVIGWQRKRRWTWALPSTQEAIAVARDAALPIAPPRFWRGTDRSSFKWKSRIARTATNRTNREFATHKLGFSGWTVRNELPSTSAQSIFGASQQCFRSHDGRHLCQQPPTKLFCPCSQPTALIAAKCQTAIAGLISKNPILLDQIFDDMVDADSSNQ
jgi:hypothetical protein